MVYNTVSNFCSDSVMTASLQTAIATVLSQYCGTQNSVRSCLKQDVKLISCNVAVMSRRLLSTNINNHVATISYSIQGGGNANQMASSLSSGQTLTAALRAQGLAGVTATGSASGSGNGNMCNPGFQDISNTCSACAAGQTSTIGGKCTDCGPGTYSELPGQAFCKPHTECDPTLLSGSARGVTNVTGTKTTDTTCTASSCDKMIEEHNRHCKSTPTKPLQCISNARVTKRCVGIRKLYRQKPCDCPPKSSRL